MKRILVLLNLVFIVSTLSAYAAVNAQSLVKGQSVTIETEYAIGDVAIADRSIVDFMVSSDRRQLYLNALREGKTTLTMWDQGGQKRSEVPITVAADHSLRDAEELTRAARRIERAVATPGVRATPFDDQMVLDGVVYSKTQAARAEEIAHLHAADVKSVIEVRDQDRRVGIGPMIELDVHMMEVKKSALKRLGVVWAPGSFPKGSGGNLSAGGGIIAGVTGLGRELLGFVFNLLPKIRFAREQGDARVLENPSFVVKSGEKGELFSGTEVPYLKGEETHFKQVGISITAEPIVIGKNIDLRITATLSAPSASLDGGIDRNTITTTAICPEGLSLALANVIRSGDVKMKNRIPKDIDTSTALFSLVASRDFQANRSEFVIFVTPRIIEQPTEAQIELRKWLETEEAMIRDRSKKEYESYMAEQGLTGNGGTRTSRSSRRGKRWD